MIEQLVWRFLEYRKKKQAVIIATMLTGLVAILPAADEYTAARSRYSYAQHDLEEAQRQISSLPKFTQLFEKRRAELAALEKQSLNPAAAQALRDTLLQLVQETGCTLSKNNLSPPTYQDWRDKDDPLNATSLARGNETPFRLVTQQFSLTIIGEMPNLNAFLKQLSKIDRLIHTRSISLQRRDREATTMVLELEIALYDLARKAV